MIGKRAACVLIAVLLTGQAAAAAEAPVEFVIPSDAEETTLTLTWHSPYSDPQTQDPFYLWAQASFENWEDKEGVTLELLPVTGQTAESPEGPWGEALSQYAGREGECPDLIVGETSFLEQDAGAGVLTDLSLDISEYGEWSWYYEAVQDMASSGNGVYGVPFEARTAGLWYQEAALAEAGVIDFDEDDNRYEAWEPESREEILEACEELRKADREAACLDASNPLLYNLLLRSAGGRLATAEGNWIVESDKIENTLQFVRDLCKQGGDGGELILPAFSEPEEEGYVFAAMPAVQEGGPAVSFAEGKLFEIPQASPDKEIAFLFACHMMSKDNYAAYMASAAKEGGLCVRRDMQDLPEIAENPGNALRQSLLTGAAFQPETGHYLAAEDCVREMLQIVLDDPTDAGISEALETYADSMREAYGSENCRPLEEEEEEE